MRKVILIILALLLGAGLYFFFSCQDRQQVMPEETSRSAAIAEVTPARPSDGPSASGGSLVPGGRPKSHRRASGSAVSAGAADRGPDPDDEEAGDEDEPKRTPAEKKLAADIEKALDEENFELAKKCAPLAMACKDVEIRQSMVDTLGWFGEKAIPELTPFIADPDEDVAESAMNEWDMAVSSIEDEGRKIGVVEMAMQVLSDDDALESISNEYIGVDEKLAVESLLRIIEGGGSAKGIEKAKETYEFVTGDEFTDRAAAEKWVAEEYQPPDPDE